MGVLANQAWTFSEFITCFLVLGYHSFLRSSFSPLLHSNQDFSFLVLLLFHDTYYHVQGDHLGKKCVAVSANYTPAPIPCFLLTAIQSCPPSWGFG